jgi:hypothetical protein
VTSFLAGDRKAGLEEDADKSQDLNVDLSALQALIQLFSLII